ncbi:Ig-like domain-containing protein [Streptomyces sp. DHE7-1]|nr:Ig-like domain-containing protein [Streptomyces sp. DHE7-1]
MAKKGGESFTDYFLSCVMLVFIGAVVFVGCSMENFKPDWAESSTPTTKATQSAEPDWRLDDAVAVPDNYIHWVDVGRPHKFDPLDSVSAEDVNSSTLSEDYLDDDEGLTPADVEVQILSKPKYGTVEINKRSHVVTYTTWADFEGTDDIRYSIKLKGKPDVLERTYSVAVYGDSP